jgi:streptomycin 6-kinase
MFDEYLVRWGLVADGDPIVTRSSRLLPVRQRDVPAVLKIALEAEEQRGGRLECWPSKTTPCSWSAPNAGIH